MKKNTKILIFFFIFLLIMQILSVSSINAYEDENFSVNLYFSWMTEDGSWHEWIDVTHNYYTDLNLKINQTIRCKVKITCNSSCTLSFEIIEPGVTTFEVIEGNSHSESIYYRILDPEITDIEEIKASDNEFYQGESIYTYSEVGDEINYVWFLRTTDRWVGGHAPINIFWQISPSASEKDIYGEWIFPDEIGKEQTFTNPYIENEQWTGPSYSSDDDDDDGNSNANENTNKSTPGFEALILVFALCVVLFIYRKR